MEQIKKKVQKTAIWFFILLFPLSFIDSPKVKAEEVSLNKIQMADIIQQIYMNRNTAMLEKDVEGIEAYYDKNTRYGLWAYQHEEKKMKYLHNWAEKQGVTFSAIMPKVVIRTLKGNESKISANLICSTEYRYFYEGKPQEENRFKIGTYHIISLAKQAEGWIITKEWYTDPFADSLNLENIKADAIREFILSQSAREISQQQRRLSAVAYADQYCGAASEDYYGFKYNRKYKDHNPLGGDCANFASQILYEGAKFRKNGTWNYDGTTGSKAWVNAQAFKNYMVGSGRASVIAHGNYERVYKASYKLQPGDFVAYEKKGKITHISVVTGADTNGYSFVNCHNTDRYRVPWDLGWSNKSIKFWLIRVHY